MLANPEVQNLLLTWLIPVVLIIVAIVFQWPVIRNALYERKLLATIRKYGHKTLHDMMLPDGLDGMTYIEHLVLTADKIMVIYLKRYRGNIFAGDNIEDWTQVIERNSYRFPNPLRQLELETMAVSNIVPTVDVAGSVIFTDESNFPKGKPERVMLFSEFEARVNEVEQGNSVPAKLEEAWQTLTEQSEPCSQEFIKNMHETRNVRGNGMLSGLFIIAAGVWLGWRLLING